MELQFKEEKIGNAPVIMVYQDSPYEAAKKGTILFYHGMLSHKMGSEKEVKSLAENGFLTVSVDNFGHGGRKISDYNTRFSSHNPDFESSFINAVEETVNEVPFIVDELSKEIICDSKLGICGISMGGFIVYGAVAKDKRFKVACPIAGCPKWPRGDSPHLKPEHFYPTALLAQNGGNDVSVWPTPAREFNQVLLPYYAAEPEKLVYVEFEGEGHFMSEQGWFFLWENVLTWFKHFL